MSSKRGLKNRTPFSNSLNSNLLIKLKKLSNDTSIPMSKLLDKGIELVLKHYGVD